MLAFFVLLHLPKFCLEALSSISLCWADCMYTQWKGKFVTACEKSCFSLLHAAWDRETSASQQQKFHTYDVNQCLRNESGSHGAPNANLFDFMFRLVDFGKVLCSSVRASDISRKKKQNFAGFSGANSRKNRPISLDFRGKKVKICSTIGRFCRIFAVEKSKFAEKSADFAGF